MKTIKCIFIKHLFTTTIVIILLFSSFLRFINYSERWGLAYDQSHDALIARYAVETWKLPFLGPFSSAGPFQTGGAWYWIIMAGTVIYPWTVISPWIFMTLLYVFFVFLIIKVSQELINKNYALIVGVFAAVSTAQITQSINLTNQSPQALLSLLAIWCSMRYLKGKRKRDIFLLGLFVGIASSIHLQGAALGLLIISTFLFAGIPAISSIFIVGAGLLLPWFPVFIVDAQNNFFNTKNMLQYYLNDQYKISMDVLGRRWLTYIGIFWPKLWGFVIGGHSLAGYILPTMMLLLSIYAFIKRIATRDWIVLGLSFILMVVLLRYTRTPLFESYIVFLHPFILLFSGLVIFTIYSRIRIAGIILMILLVTGSLVKSYEEVTIATNHTADFAQSWSSVLKLKYPDKQVVLYDYKYDTRGQSFPLALYLDVYGVKAEKKVLIGVTATNSAKLRYSVIKKKDTIQLVEFKQQDKGALLKNGWIPVTPEYVYKDTQEWFLFKKLNVL